MSPERTSTDVARVRVDTLMIDQFTLPRYADGITQPGTGLIAFACV